uniref:Nebulette n=1 Tax=Oryzias latipes TaxID=8090 RepID=A0A3P9J2L7_ORYLA
MFLPAPLQKRKIQDANPTLVLFLFHKVKYKEDGKKDLSHEEDDGSKPPSVLSHHQTFKGSQTAVMLRDDWLSLCVFVMQVKYKGACKKDMSSPLYHHLPETAETQFAKQMSEIQSEKYYKEKYNREKGKADYTNMKTLPDVQHAMEVTKNQSEVGYRRGKEELHHCNMVPDRPDMLNAANAAKLASDVAYKNHTKLPVYSDCSLLTRTDIQHANEVSKLTSQVKYKENFDRHLKGQRPSYNPLECLSFRHTQAAAALASQVKYRTNQNQRPEGSLDLQLEHALHASKLQSNAEYKKKYEQTKAYYHMAVDTAEQLHHKETAVLHSQVKYREEYEKNRGRSQMEFGETPAYKVSKEVQKMQSEKEYRRDYEEHVKGKALVEVDQTPGYLTARHAGSLLSEKEYKKDLEQEVKGRGLSGTHVCHMLSCKEYRKDLERDIVGKGMALSADVLEMQRAKRASEIQSQPNQSRTKMKGLCISPALGVYSPLRVCLFLQKKYKDDAERLKEHYSLVSETPEMERVRANQRHFSSAQVQYREEVGRGTAVTETFEMERVRRNQENISSVSFHTEAAEDGVLPKLYEQNPAKATSVGVTPEVERVKQNQENISSARLRTLYHNLFSSKFVPNQTAFVQTNMNRDKNDRNAGNITGCWQQLIREKNL